MKDILSNLFRQAIRQVVPDDTIDCDPAIHLATRPEFGDYQANFALKLSKQLHRPPRDIANAVIAHVQNDDILQTMEPSGPGFINLVMTNTFLAAQLQKLVDDKRLGIVPAATPQTIVVDYANANVAKEMHVGHIRSIVIGDAIIRLFHFLGHHTIKQSHLGDWGTQFGMLIEHVMQTGGDITQFALTDLDALYKQSKKRFDEEPDFAEKARQRVVALQQGDAVTLKIWQQLVKDSLTYFQTIYDKLDVLMTEEDARGESFYNPFLPGVVSELEKQGMAQTDDGAKVVFLEGYTTPYIIQKKDGGYLYATTDIAAAKFRMEQLHANRIIYLTDARQKQHFSMLFATLQQAGWVPPTVKLEHIPFGAILGPDNKPFKTRSGESIRLIDLLEEAETRAKQLSREKNPNLNDQQLQTISHAIGIGALKYADLRADKIKDYVFDWDKLLSFDGNTAPYLQNAYVRISAIFRKGNIKLDEIKQTQIVLTTEMEHILAVKLLGLSDLLQCVAEDLALHRLCDYLYDLAATYHRFYEHCPILSTTDQQIRNSRLLLSDITARTLHLGLDLLGIRTLEQM